MKSPPRIVSIRGGLGFEASRSGEDSGQLFVPRTAIDARFRAGATPEISFVLAVIAFQEDDFAGILECQDMRGDTIEEPA
ncbi:hypothetical protein, partial [Nevskia ramosa]|uniref:hypothetical protein n=1 Tax=Nevskia ramosa TaxID=64002 RepID=UPI002353C331